VDVEVAQQLQLIAGGFSLDRKNPNAVEAQEQPSPSELVQRVVQGEQTNLELLSEVQTLLKELGL
jgi:hypothetical protein